MHLELVASGDYEASTKGSLSIFFVTGRLTCSHHSNCLSAGGLKVCTTLEVELFAYQHQQGNQAIYLAHPGYNGAYNLLVLMCILGLKSSRILASNTILLNIWIIRNTHREDFALV